MTSAASSMTVADRLPLRSRASRVPYRTLLAGGVVALCLVPRVALAGEPAHARGRADELFKEGRALLDANKLDEACPKLAESQRLDPGAGTLLALALCHEGQGKTATARKELEEAARLGRSVGRNDLADAAEKRARAMEPQLSRLVVRMPEGGADYDVRCDGAAVDAETRGKPIAVDPGDHKIEVSARGKKSRTYSVRVSGAGVLEILVDPLEESAAPAASAAAKAAPAKAARVTPVSEPAVPPDSSSGGAQRAIGLTLGGIGLVGLGTGAYFTGRGFSQSAEAKRACPTTACPEGFADEANDRAKSSFAAGVVSVSVGTVLLATGVIVYLTAPSKPASSASKATPPKRTARVVPEAGPTQLGVGFVGTF